LSSSETDPHAAAADVVAAAEEVSGTRSPQKPVLAIDTSLNVCAVAVYDAALGQTLAVQSLPMQRGHAEHLLPLIAQVMREAGVSFAQLDRVATTIGPGSFTGLRVGIAAARGIALAADRPAVGISTLDALTAPYVTDTETVPIVAAIDASHGNFYLQMVGAGGRKLVPPRVASLAEALRAVAIGLVRIIGSGAELIAREWPAPNIPTPLLVDPRPAPDIIWVARLGARADAAKARPKPLYLRAPDARPQDAQRLQRR
jgi:tRNA threonylcarbamoyladenosine biosynthesis protein TsaB